MLKKYLILLPLVGLFAFAKNERQSHTCTTKSGKYTYETKDGRIDGTFVSWYPNGKKKAEGTFVNTFRNGTWTIWDSTGAMLLKREYSDPLTFTQTFPLTGPSIKDKPDEPARNTDGYYNYSSYREKDVIWSKRVWRYIEPANNAALFNDNRLFRVIHKAITEQGLTASIAEKNEAFGLKFSTPADTSGFRIIGYKIMEDAFFDKSRCVSETRTVGICPVAVDKKTGDTTNLYWIYMPYARKMLAAEKVSLKSGPAAVQTLDDLFYFRCFSGPIYKESNVNDRTIAAYTPKAQRAAEAERIEMEMIDTEHDLWLRFKE